MIVFTLFGTAMAGYVEANREVSSLEVLSPQAPLGANERAGRNRGFALLSTD